MCWWGQPEASFRLQLQDSWVPVQLRFDKQVSAWIRSINPTPSARAVDEISFLISMFVSVIRSQVRALMPVRRAEMCVVAFHPQSVSAWFPARSWGCAVSPPDGASSALLSPPLCLFSNCPSGHSLSPVTSHRQQVADNQSDASSPCFWGCSSVTHPWLI